jgi:hypothetical protein
MNSQELIQNLLRMGPQDTCVIFNYLADHAAEARLANGERLCDVTDVVVWLRELGDAASHVEIVDRTCPRCGHIHQGDTECGEPIGGGRVCRCELDVPA